MLKYHAVDFSCGWINPGRIQENNVERSVQYAAWGATVLTFHGHALVFVLSRVFRHVFQQTLIPCFVFFICHNTFECDTERVRVATEARKCIGNGERIGVLVVVM
jgi:hypothetical protein